MIAKSSQALLAVLGYVCTATVVTLVAGLAYLWQTERLNDEKVFRMVALFHDVDLHQIAEAQRKNHDEVPPEEVSLSEALRRQQYMDRNYEVKLLSLRRGRQEFDHTRKSLNDLIDRYERMAQEWQNRLKQDEVLASQENLAAVVGQLEVLKPLQAKEELMLWIKNDRMDDAILLMSKMADNKLKKILEKFQTDEDLDTLYEIHRRIIDSGEQASTLNDALNELNALGSGR